MDGLLAQYASGNNGGAAIPALVAIIVAPLIGELGINLTNIQDRMRNTSESLLTTLPRILGEFVRSLLEFAQSLGMCSTGRWTNPCPTCLQQRSLAKGIMAFFVGTKFSLAFGFKIWSRIMEVPSVPSGFTTSLVRLHRKVDHKEPAPTFTAYGLSLSSTSFQMWSHQVKVRYRYNLINVSERNGTRVGSMPCLPPSVKTELSYSVHSFRAGGAT